MRVGSDWCPRRRPLELVAGLAVQFSLLAYIMLMTARILAPHWIREYALWF